MRLATAACMQKHGNVSFVTVARAKCMRYGGRVGDHTIGGGGGVFLLVYRLVESIYLLCLAVSRLKGV